MSSSISPVAVQQQPFECGHVLTILFRYVLGLRRLPSGKTWGDLFGILRIQQRHWNRDHVGIQFELNALNNIVEWSAAFVGQMLIQVLHVCHPCFVNAPTTSGRIFS